jgi:hypothetical protein
LRAETVMKKFLKNGGKYAAFLPELSET